MEDKRGKDEELAQLQRKFEAELETYKQLLGILLKNKEERLISISFTLIRDGPAQQNTDGVRTGAKIAKGERVQGSLGKGGKHRKSRMETRVRKVANREE